MTRDCREAGFTLYEVLVGFLLFSLLVSCFGAAFFVLARTNGALDGIAKAEEVDVVRQFLELSLESSRALHKQDQAFFRGERSRIVFTSVLGGEQQIGGIYESEIWLNPEGELIFVRRPLGWGGQIGAMPRVLLRNLSSFKISFHPCANARTMVADHWNDTSDFPKEVLISAKFKRGDTRVWRDLSVFMPSASCAGG